jgi:hypothetical protein
MPQRTQAERNAYQQDYSSRPHSAEERRIRKRKWYAANRESQAEYQRSYYWGDPDRKNKWLAYHRNYRAMQRAKALEAKAELINTTITDEC